MLFSVGVVFATPAHLVFAAYYGEPSRVAFSAMPEGVVRQVAEQSVVMLVPDAHLDVATMHWNGKSVAAQWGIYDEHPLAREAALATCSGVLVSESLVITAAHCVPAAACDRFHVVHAVGGEGPNEPRIRDVVPCRAVRERDVTRDVAILELARPLMSGTPAPFCDEPLVGGERVTACGSSFGSAPRCDSQGLVVGPRRVQADLAVGSSGGPLIDADGLVRAIVVDGANDLVWNGTCFDEARLSPEAVGEGIADLRDLQASLTRLGLESTCEGATDLGGASKSLVVYIFVVVLLLAFGCARWRRRFAVRVDGRV